MRALILIDVVQHAPYRHFQSSFGRMDDSTVSFTWKDFRNGAAPRRMTLAANEFIRVSCCTCWTPFGKNMLEQTCWRGSPLITSGFRGRRNVITQPGPNSEVVHTHHTSWHSCNSTTVSAGISSLTCHCRSISGYATCTAARSYYGHGAGSLGHDLGCQPARERRASRRRA